MKNKYARMNKEEKKQCRTFYYNTPKGKEMKMRLTRLTIIGIIGIIFSVFLVVSGYIAKQINWATWAMAGILFCFSIVFLVGAAKIRLQVLNQYAITKMK